MARGEAQVRSLAAQLEQQRKTNVELRVRIVRYDAELANVRETEHLTAQASTENSPLRRPQAWQLVFECAAF